MLLYSEKEKMQTQNLYQTLKAHLSTAGEERRHGSRLEFHTDCPWCGKEVKRGQSHFSFSEDGGFCFVCQGGAGLYKLAALYLGQDDLPERVPQVRRVTPPKRTPAWRRDKSLVSRYVSHGGAAQAWENYKPMPAAVRLGYRLGFGVLPSSRCKVPRLIVPIFAGGELRALRGRSVNRRGCRYHYAGLCASGSGDPVSCPKWLPAAGSQTLLYNGARLLHPGQREGASGLKLGDTVGNLDARGRVLFIVENPVDALLVETLTDAAAVATLSVSYWLPGWTKALQAAGVGMVVVAYDNDVPGNGNTAAAWALWRENPKHKDILPGGVALVNRLNAAGVPARLFPWEGHPAKADIGGLLLELV